jgi:hypothetical protein
MKEPVIAMQGRIEDIANARRQDRMYARIKPVKKAAKKLQHIATFSEMPCWTRSTEINEKIVHDICAVEKLTRVGLNTSSYLTCPHAIKEGNVLTQNGLQISFS